MSLFEFPLSTDQRVFHDITPRVRSALTRSGLVEGLCVVFCPHTTAAVTINENADPDVLHDLALGLERAFPDQPGFRHAEGNSAAHLKSSCVGAGETLLVRDGQLLLGTWQSVYFCEFDGPRHRRFYVKTL